MTVLVSSFLVNDKKYRTKPSLEYHMIQSTPHELVKLYESDHLIKELNDHAKVSQVRPLPTMTITTFLPTSIN